MEDSTSTGPITAPSSDRRAPAWLLCIPRHVRALGRCAKKALQKTIGFARRTGGTTADSKHATARAPEEAGVEGGKTDTPESLIFRPSLVNEYKDIFTHAPLTRQTTRTVAPSRATTQIAPAASHFGDSLRVEPNLRLANLHPTIIPVPEVDPPPPGAQYAVPQCAPTPPSSVPSRVTTPDPDSCCLPVKLWTIDGNGPPLIPLRVGRSVPVLSLFDGQHEEEPWSVEAIRFDPDNNCAIIIASYDGFATPVIVPYDIAGKLPSRKKVWEMFRAELSDASQAVDDHHPISEAQLRVMHEQAHARVIWEMTKVSRKELPPLQHQAPIYFGLHVVRLLGMHALPDL